MPGSKPTISARSGGAALLEKPQQSPKSKARLGLLALHCQNLLGSSSIFVILLRIFSLWYRWPKYICIYIYIWYLMGLKSETHDLSSIFLPLRLLTSQQTCSPTWAFSNCHRPMTTGSPRLLKSRPWTWRRVWIPRLAQTLACRVMENHSKPCHSSSSTSWGLTNIRQMNENNQYVWSCL